MHFMYLNNYRGFSTTVLPIQQVNFLVGENSTGKSSVLALLSLLAQPQFWFHADFSLLEFATLRSFDDIVSAWSRDRSFFQVGAASTERTRDGRTKLRLSVMTFGNSDGSPRLEHFLSVDDGHAVELRYQRSRVQYRISEVDEAATSHDEVAHAIHHLADSWRRDDQKYENLPGSYPGTPPVIVALSMLQEHLTKKPRQRHMFHVMSPVQGPLTSIAPIRSTPRRIYDSAVRSYSPEGDHVPHVLRRTLRARSSSPRFVKRLQAFGEESGLFEAIVAHSFGRTKQSPFELVVHFKGAALNISNVGYGVSQALPLVVEFLLPEERRSFAVQQPEVHLHPRAQAALGDLIYAVSREKKHAFFVETHSDYLVDRFRLALRAGERPISAQVLFFVRGDSGNVAHILPISPRGMYPMEQPRAFREFFLREESRLFEL